MDSFFSWFKISAKNNNWNRISLFIILYENRLTHPIKFRWVPITVLFYRKHLQFADLQLYEIKKKCIFGLLILFYVLNRLHVAREIKRTYLEQWKKERKKSHEWRSDSFVSCTIKHILNVHEYKNKSTTYCNNHQYTICTKHWKEPKKSRKSILLLFSISILNGYRCVCKLCIDCNHHLLGKYSAWK